jgi:hypothetical protein
VAPTTGTEQPYASAMGILWPDLARTLSRLDAIAGDPDAIDDDELVVALGTLRYHLHLGSEHVYGLSPPPGAETAHAELAAALAAARDATAEVADAAASGEDANALVPEWRGALFRVRLARLRLATPAPARPAPPELPQEGLARPLGAFLLALLGALALVGGATLGVWPLWAIGIVAVCSGVLVYRP